jgi:hypothetical protein
MSGLQRRQRRLGLVGRSDHDIGVERHDFLGAAVGDGQRLGAIGIEGQIRIARPFGEAGDLPGIGERDDQLVRAHVERHDAPRRGGRGGGAQQHGEQRGGREAAEAEHGTLS